MLLKRQASNEFMKVGCSVLHCIQAGHSLLWVGHLEVWLLTTTVLSPPCLRVLQRCRICVDDVQALGHVAMSVSTCSAKPT